MIIQTPMQTATKHLRAFYAERNHADYTAFVQACQKFAEACRIPFVEASARVHASCSNANKLTRKVTAKMLRTVAHDATYPSRCLLTYNDSYNVDRYGITQSEAAVIRRALVDICGSIGVGRSYSSVTVREINQRIEQLHGFSTN